MEDQYNPSIQSSILASRINAPAQFFSLPLPRATITVLAPCGIDAVIAGSRDGLLTVVDLFGAMHPPQVRCQYSQLERPANALAVDCLSDDGVLSVAGAQIFVAIGGNVIERYILSGNSIALPDGVMDDGPTKLVGHGRGAITALTACDRLLYSAANDMTFRMWDCRACVQLAVLASGVEAPCALSVSGESGLLLSASNAGAGQISVWRLPALLTAGHGSGGGTRDLRQLCLAPVALVSRAVVGSFARASLGLKQATASKADELASREAATDQGGSLECAHTFALAENQVHSISFADGGLSAASASHTGELQVWGVEPEHPREQQSWTYKHLGHMEPIKALALVGDAVVTTSSDRTLRVSRCPQPVSAGGSKHSMSAWGTPLGWRIGGNSPSRSSPGKPPSTPAAPPPPSVTAEEKAAADADAVLNDLDDLLDAADEDMRTGLSLPGSMP
jgi:WD40 repeat protein